MIKLRKLVLIAIIFILSFSTFGFGASNASAKSLKNLPSIQLEKPKTIISKSLLNPEKPDKKVRIVVELEGEPAIEKATKKGVLYKKLKPSERKKIEAQVAQEQEIVQEEIADTVPSIEYEENFAVVFNGFSAEVEAKYVEKIAETSGVKAVYESTRYEAPKEKVDMANSKELVQAQDAWRDFGYTGEGMVVGIIDTGIDPSHKDLTLSDPSKAEVTEAEVNTLLDNNTIENGAYYTDKVPFGYNYMDGNNIIIDKNPETSMHGMHVAGTVAANGDDENGGIKGIAPEAQLLALKVFGNDPAISYTYSDIYIKAIDDAIKLNADVLNMSLGSPAGFVDSESAEQQAVSRATNNGIIVAISSGNEDLYGSEYYYPYAENQDYGLTGSPGISYDSISVASFENSEITAYSFDYQIDGTQTGQALYLLANDVDPIKTLSGEVEVVDAGIGSPEDFEGKDFNGKIALISRGTINFVDKGLNAQAAGAVAAIIYNNTTGTISMASDPNIEIPYMSILQSDGLALKAALDENRHVTISFANDFISIANPESGLMSNFTSWGPTPNLDFKPEITAPGGNIFSTLNDNRYGTMSGTSMAAPHVAGGSALLLQRIDEEFGLTGAERVQLAKNLLMNTAEPVIFYEDRYGVEYVSPRRQGAGLMKINNSLLTDVIITNSATHEAKVALKEIKDEQFTLTLTAENFSNEPKTYSVDTQIQMDYPYDDSGLYINAPNLLGQIVLNDDVEIDAPETVTIPANGTSEITINVDVSGIPESLRAIYTNGFFVDGFVTLTDPDSDITGNVPLSVPFFGFNGEWDDARIFDYFAWDDLTYWGYTLLADEKGEIIMGNGDDFDPTRFGFSPNGDGVRDQVIPVFSLFRNAKQLKVEVVDKKGKVLRTIETADELEKNYSYSEPLYFESGFAWDGKINNKLAKDGDYKIRLSAVIDYEGAEWQSIEFPVKIDTVKPTAKASFNSNTKTISISNFTDSKNGTGVEYWNVLVNGEVVAEGLPTTTKTYTLTSSLKSKDKVTVQVVDVAGNANKYDFIVPNAKEKTPPVITVDSPHNNAIFNTNKVVVKGTVIDDSKITSVTVNNAKATLDGLKFSHTLKLPDGVHDIKVKAVDEWKNESQTTRKVIVDTKAPTISIKNNYPTSTTENSVTVKVTLKDNFDQIRLTVNGVEKFKKDLSKPYAMKNFQKEIDVRLNLVDGDNEFVFEAKDVAGNITKQKIKIKKKTKNSQPPGKGNGKQ